MLFAKVFSLMSMLYAILELGSANVAVGLTSRPNSRGKEERKKNLSSQLSYST